MVCNKIFSVFYLSNNRLWANSSHITTNSFDFTYKQPYHNDIYFCEHPKIDWTAICDVTADVTRYKI